MTRINQNTNYWAGNLTGSLDMWWREDLEGTKGRDVVALAGYRRAIANFVNIVTSRTDIPVTYNAADESFTDGKKVYLSGNMSDKNFDPNVGLALHEGSHIVHTNFELLQELNDKVAKHFDYNRKNISYSDPMRNVHATRHERIKNLLNYVEDRRIDYPGLREIYRVVDLMNIKRLKTTDEALEVAFKIYDIILKHVDIDAVNENDEEGNSQGDGAEGDEDDESSEGAGSGSGKSSDVDPNQEASFGSDDSGEGTSIDMPELSPAQLRSLENAIKKQNELVNGGSKKTKLTKTEKASVKAVEDSGAYNVQVGTGTEKTHCVVIPRLTEAMLNTDWNTRELYPFISPNNRWSSTNSEEAVTKGLVIGKMLGKKLKIRNEERTTKWSRQDSGRLDKRIIAELGFDNERVFKTSYTEKYNDAFIHISIDGSGSMNGQKLENAIKSTAAICQAASMAGNIHVQVTLRTTTSSGRSNHPVVVVLYDSNINNISHIRKYWVNLRSSGTTPEGLCFEALSKQIIKDATGRDSFFLNYSDGMPYYADDKIHYSGTIGIKHTRSEVDKMRMAGIEVLSFFIAEYDGYERSNTLGDFKKMYGKDATTINPTKVIELAKELNKKFLQK